jgi:hypothetical protein
MTKLTIELRPSERKALREIAYLERRDLHDQAAHLVRCELARRGLLVDPSAGNGADVVALSPIPHVNA